ncbi:processed acidic surface protein [Gottfriedia sp. NPDC057991]|uniref:processed acidic surface protein n=1 Tax=Gottfriedia sp. NPDC057991 TaxID=3346298 RepID=UPI0036D7B599
MKKITASIVLTAALLAPGAIASAAPKQSDLDTYLASIHLTQSQLENYLESYGDSLDDYDTVAELKETLGDRLTAKNLAAILAKNHVTEAEITKVAIESDDMDPSSTLLDTYLFTSDIEYLIAISEDSSDDAGDLSLASDFSDFEKIGITQAEIDALTNHLETVFENDPTAADKMDELMGNIASLSEKDTTDFTPAETALYINTVKELEQTMKVDFKVTDSKGNVMKPLDFLALTSLDGHVLRVLDENGNLLLDMNLSDDMFADVGDMEDGLINDSKDIINKVSEKATTHHTEKGGKLPKTASDTTEMAMVGAILLAAGFVLRKKRFQ